MDWRMIVRVVGVVVVDGVEDGESGERVEGLEAAFVVFFRWMGTLLPQSITIVQSSIL